MLSPTPPCHVDAAADDARRESARHRIADTCASVSPDDAALPRAFVTSISPSPRDAIYVFMRRDDTPRLSCNSEHVCRYTMPLTPMFYCRGSLPPLALTPLYDAACRRSAAADAAPFMPPRRCRKDTPPVFRCRFHFAI